MYNLNTSNTKIIDLVEQLAPGTEDVIVFFFSENELEADIPMLISDLNERGVHFVGGIFPGLVTQHGKADTGVIINKFKRAADIILFKNVSAKQLEMPDLSGWEGEPPTCLTLVDGLSANIDHLLNHINDNLGHITHFIGGGAGSLTLKQQKCLFCNEGFFQDAAIVCPIQQQSKLGVRHGWEKLYGPVVATRTEGTTIYELNWQPAFQVYKEVIEADLGKSIDANNFFSIAKAYPFGIYRENREDIIRDPLSVGENDSIICIGEVPAHAVLNIMKSNPDKLALAAGKAVDDCQEAENIVPTQTLVVDCISRALFLEHHFSKEVDAIRNQLPDGAQNIEGILSLGEISSVHKGLLEFYNKTVVVGLFH